VYSPGSMDWGLRPRRAFSVASLIKAWTASTLRLLLPQDTQGGAGLEVELAMAARGGRGQSQGNAAAGVVNRRRVMRRISVPGTPRTIPLETIQAALLRDPISMAYRSGGVLLHEEVVVE